MSLIVWRGKAGVKQGFSETKVVMFVGGLGGVRKSREKTNLLTVVDGCKGG